MKKVLTTSLIALTILCLHGCTNADDAIEKLISDVNNNDIQIDGTSIGLILSMSDRAKSLSSRLKPEHAPLLIDALHDDKRFVVAHVLLTFMTKKRFVVDSGSWNGLRVEIHADGRAVIDENQRVELIQFWLKTLESRDH